MDSMERKSALSHSAGARKKLITRALEFLGDLLSIWRPLRPLATTGIHIGRGFLAGQYITRRSLFTFTQAIIYFTRIIVLAGYGF